MIKNMSNECFYGNKNDAPEFMFILSIIIIFIN